MKQVFWILIFLITSLNAESREHLSIRIDNNCIVKLTRTKKIGKISGLTHTVYGYHPYWVSSTAVDNYRFELLSHIACFSVEANSDGTLGDKHGWHTSSLWQKIITKAKQAGTKVILVCTLMDRNELAILLSSATYRTRLIKNLLTEVQTGDVDGINIDFEDMPGSQKNNFSIFMQELNNTFKAARSDYHVTLCGPSVDWRNAFDYDVLMNNSDGIMIMAYGYYYAGSATAGPVSLLQEGSGWSSYHVKFTIADYLQYGNNQPDKMILGIPYYGRDWPTATGDAHSSTRGTGTAVVYKYAVVNAASYGRRWQDDVKNPWYRYQNSGWHQCWYDDEISLGYKYDEVLSNDLQGIGIWALGYDDGRDELWDKIEEYFWSTSFRKEQTSIPKKHTRILTAYPNPFRKRLNFKITIEQAGLYTLSLHDIKGRKITEIFSKQFSKGSYIGKLQRQHLSFLQNGVYFLHLEGKQKRSCKLLYIGK